MKNVEILIKIAFQMKVSKMKNSKRIVILLLLISAVFSGTKTFGQTTYGSNQNAGKYITLNGIKHYYEIYGEGKPLLLIHGNSTGISGWAAQIEFFKKSFKVYAIDCRGRGKSELGNDSLTYMQQANDMAQFIKEMKMDSVMIVGKSDGGIIALLMAIYFPEHISKIVSFSANLEPDSTALFPQSVIEIHKERIHAEEMLAKKDTSQNWELIRQRNRMMEFQPHVSADDLQKITIPVLVMSTDRDVVKEDHTFFIYKNIAKANLSFISGESHKIARKNPDLFNAVVFKYLKEPFLRNSFRFEN